MSRLKTTILAFTIAAAFMAVLPADANADGPLRQWLRGLWRPSATSATAANTGRGLFNCCGNRAPQALASTANFAPQTQQALPASHNVANLQPGQCMKTCQKTCSRTVVNYVPYTAYRTAYKRVPVTQYRPETNTDPCTGCVVTCMKPCTTYTYQCQRVPYTTYRPVYRQETYKVPVTTITNDCATGNCSTGTCAPCNAGAVGGSGTANQVPGLGNFGPTPAAGSGTTTNFAPTTSFAPSAGSSTTNFAPPSAGSSTTTNFAPEFVNPPAPTSSTFFEQVPSGTISPSGGATFGSGTRYNAPVPATEPSVNPLQNINPLISQRPFLDRFNKSSGSNRQASTLREIEDEAPARFNINDKTAASPVRKQWGYSPVRTASYNKPTTTRAQMAPIKRSRSNELNGWKEVN